MLSLAVGVGFVGAFDGGFYRFRKGFEVPLNDLFNIVLEELVVKDSRFPFLFLLRKGFEVPLNVFFCIIIIVGDVVGAFVEGVTQQSHS